MRLSIPHLTSDRVADVCDAVAVDCDDDTCAATLRLAAEEIRMLTDLAVGITTELADIEDEGK